MIEWREGKKERGNVLHEADVLDYRFIITHNIVEDIASTFVAGKHSYNRCFGTSCVSLDEAKNRVCHAARVMHSLHRLKMRLLNHKHGGL